MAWVVLATKNQLIDGANVRLKFEQYKERGIFFPNEESVLGSTKLALLVWNGCYG
jgi:hypothetical protein